MQQIANVFRLPVETPAGSMVLEVSRTVLYAGNPQMQVILCATVQGKNLRLEAETTEDALIQLGKRLPEGWFVRSCISCRHGHFCPVGNGDNELFCVPDFAPKTPRDLWYVTEDTQQRSQRSRSLFDCCDGYAPQSADYYTYNDYLNSVKR